MTVAAIDSARFSFEETGLAGLRLVRFKPLADERGVFARGFCASEFAAAGFDGRVAQANVSVTVAPGTVRGLHFQHPPAAEQKLVCCVAGSVFDVAVDVRRGSPTFLHWYGVTLAGAATTALLIPPGFAHGFQALEAGATLLYLVSTAYRADLEDGLHPVDPAVGIRWPQQVTLMSPRDAARPWVDAATWPGVRLPQERAGG